MEKPNLGLLVTYLREDQMCLYISVVLQYTMW